MIDHLADLESDLSVFHRVDDIYALDGPRFMRLAWRASAYKGVMRMRLEDQEHRAREGGLAPAAASPAPPPGRGGGTAGPSPRGAKVVPLAAFMANYPGAVERRRSKRKER